MIPTLKAITKKGPENIPVPAVVFPRTYRILNPPMGAAGACSAEAGLYGTPLDNSPQSESIRAHEYAHLAIHKQKPELDKLSEMVPGDWYQCGLDNIVNGFAISRGVDVSHLPIHRNMPKDTPRRLRAIHALQTLSLKKRKTFAGLTHGDIKLLKQASRKLRYIGASDSPADCDEVASILKQLELRFGTQATIENRADLASLFAAGDQVSGAGFVPWCPMNTITRTLDRKVARKYLERKRIAGFMGAFRNPLRALLPAMDGQAWSIKKRKIQGGTILLDQSGSMNLSSEQVQKMLENAPHATVAGYSGDGDTGELRILATGGKYALDCSNGGMGGNCVDGPALDWLAKQQGPRVWICDGIVTGKRDNDHPILYAECARKCVDYSILRVNSIGEYFRMAGIG